MEALLEGGGSEVDEEADWHVEQTEVSEHLLPMDRRQPLDGFQLHHHQAFDEEVNAKKPSLKIIPSYANSTASTMFPVISSQFHHRRVLRVLRVSAWVLPSRNAAALLVTQATTDLPHDRAQEWRGGVEGSDGQSYAFVGT